MMAQHSAAFIEPGTDSQQPIAAHRGREHPRFSIVPAPETVIAPGMSIDLPISVTGTLLHLREFERALAWITESPAATAESELAEATEGFFRLPDEIEASIAKLVTLPHGWDGYDGSPVQASVAECARRLLKTDLGIHVHCPGRRPALGRRIAVGVVRRCLRGRNRNHPRRHDAR